MNIKVTKLPDGIGSITLPRTGNTFRLNVEAKGTKKELEELNAVEGVTATAADQGGASDTANTEAKAKENES